MSSPKVDPLEQLAFAIDASPGVYALLLGSGLSTSAGVPTGWDVVRDLARRLAVQRGVEAAKADEWFEQTFGERPKYSSLVEALASTPSDRRNLLRSYFEPNDEERSEGVKVPSAAHRAVASIVASGAVRVIITTNFDQLIETALREAGVTPQVISSADDATGALPLAHARCTVLKVNGDYLDTRIRNTEGELSAYEAEIEGLIDQVFDEYGLVICGWSGEWDFALRAALKRAKRRFAAYWCYRSSPPDITRSLLDFRQATRVKIDSADSFFDGLGTRLTALKTVGRQNPASVALLLSRVKRNLASGGLIELHDTLRDEVDLARRECLRIRGESQVEMTTDVIRLIVSKLDAASERSAVVLAAGCYWGDDATDDLWIRILRGLIGVVPFSEGGNLCALSLGAYAARRCMYVAGLASLSARKYQRLARFLRLETPFEEGKLFVGHEYFRSGHCERALFDEVRKTAMSDHLLDSVRPILTAACTHDFELDSLFDEFEVLLSLMTASQDSIGHAMAGRFCWRRRQFSLPRYATRLRMGDLSDLRRALYGDVIEEFDARVTAVRQIYEHSAWMY